MSHRFQIKGILAWVLALLCCAGGARQSWGQAAAPGAEPSAPTGIAPALTGVSPVQTPASSGMPVGNPSMLYPGEDFLLSAGDLLAVHVFMEPDYQATGRVAPDGTAELPFIGSVELRGLTVREAQTLIADRLRVGGYYRNPEVIIQVLESLNGSVTVAGELRAVIPVTGARRLIDVLAAAGGLPATASHTVKIIRAEPGGKEETIEVNLGEDMSQSAGASTLVYPRDIIQISRAGVVYVLGAFQRQGSLPLDQAMPLTLLQAAALSGGINFEGRYQDLRLIRTVGNERKLVSVDIKKVRDGEAPDPVLQANDIVFLPTNAMKAMLKNLGVGGVIGIVSILLVAHTL